MPAAYPRRLLVPGLYDMMQLTLQINTISSIASFKILLNTHLFHKAFDELRVVHICVILTNLLLFI